MRKVAYILASLIAFCFSQPCAAQTDQRLRPFEKSIVEIRMVCLRIRQEQIDFPWFRGAGFAVGKNLVLTNSHMALCPNESGIIPITGDILVFNGGKMSPATLGANDPSKDLALLILHDPDALDLKPLPVSAEAKIGNDVYWYFIFDLENPLRVAAITHRYGYAPQDNGNMLQAFDIFFDNGVIRAQGNIFIANLVTQKGSSGGPVFNENGEVIGIITMFIRPRNWNNGQMVFIGGREIIKFLLWSRLWKPQPRK